MLSFCLLCLSPLLILFWETLLLTSLLHWLLSLSWCLIWGHLQRIPYKTFVIYPLPVFLFIHNLPLYQVQQRFPACLSSMAVSTNVLFSSLEDQKAPPLPIHCFGSNTTFWKSLICSPNLSCSSWYGLCPPFLPQILSVCFVPWQFCLCASLSY